MNRAVREAAQRLRPDLQVAATRNTYREYLERTFAAEETARAKIDAYLALTRWESGLLAALGWLEHRRATPEG